MAGFSRTVLNGCEASSFTLAPARAPLFLSVDHPLDDSFGVFDAVVKPEVTPRLAPAQRCGCRTVQAREVMSGQIAWMVGFLPRCKPGASERKVPRVAGDHRKTTDTASGDAIARRVRRWLAPTVHKAARDAAAGP